MHKYIYNVTLNCYQRLPIGNEVGVQNRDINFSYFIHI